MTLPTHPEARFQSLGMEGFFEGHSGGWGEECHNKAEYYAVPEPLGQNVSGQLMH